MYLCDLLFICFYDWLSYYSSSSISFRHYHLYHPFWAHCFYFFSCFVHMFQAIDFPPIAVKLFVVFSCLKWSIFSFLNSSFNNTLLVRLLLVSTSIFSLKSCMYENSYLIVSLHVVSLSKFFYSFYMQGTTIEVLSSLWSFLCFYCFYCLFFFVFDINHSA